MTLNLHAGGLFTRYLFKELFILIEIVSVEWHGVIFRPWETMGVGRIG